MTLELSFDFEEGDFDEMKNNASNFIFNSKDELYMTYIVPECIAAGFKEK